MPFCGEGVLPSSEARGVVERVLPGERVQQRQPRHEALFVANLQRIVVGVELVERLGNVAGPVARTALWTFAVPRVERTLWLAFRKPCRCSPWLPT